MTPIIYWFKNDLRLHDNEALTEAVKTGHPIIPIYIFDPSAYRTLDLGFPKTDAVRFEFLCQCLRELRKNLRETGAELYLFTGDAGNIIPNLVETHGCTAIYGESEFATEELRWLESVRAKLPDFCTLQLFWGRTLYHLDDIPYEISKVPLTSKAYRINTTKAASVRKALPEIKKIELFRIEDRNDLPSTRALGLPYSENYDKPYVQGGESQGVKRLHHYLFETEQLTSYRWTRNRSLGMDYSSKFSPYLALGCLSPRTIHEGVKKYEKEVKKNQSTWWLVFELVWRDYFTFKLMRFQNEVYQTEGFTKKTLEFKNDRELFDRWCEGRTGIPFIDAHMRQLNLTGYMSNRGRVNCSSFLVHDYKIDWTWGAAYFESKLIDYDVASNWMNWHMQAYQTWYTNPVHQSYKYKAQDYIRKWVPELSTLDDTSVLLPWEAEVSDYPKPIQIYSKWQRSIDKINRSG